MQFMRNVLSTICGVLKYFYNYYINPCIDSDIFLGKLNFYATDYWYRTSSKGLEELVNKAAWHAGAVLGKSK